MSLQDLHSLLLQAPLSQLPSVIADLRGLLSSPSITGADPRLSKQFEDSLPDILRRFAEQEASVVRLPGAEEGSILAPEAVDSVPPSYGSSEGAPPPTTHAYRDEGKLKRFTVEHSASASASAHAGEDYAAPSGEGAGKDELRAELDRQLQAYLRDHYPQLDKYRASEGACAQVWRQPLRKLKVLTSETQQTTQEEAMAEKLQEDRTAARADRDERDEAAQGHEDTAQQEQEKDREQAETAKEDKEQTYTPVRDTGAEHVKDTKELRPEESEEQGQAKQRDRLPLEDEDDEDAETHLVEEDDGKPTADSYVLRIVSGKSNAGNFWSGRLLSTYVYAPAAGTLSAKLKIQIHYYENGNVQLNTLAEAKSIPVPATAGTGSAAQAKAVLAAIRKHEQAYQEVLEDTYAALNDRAFKSLRRQLPVTRQKVDWDKVSAVRAKWAVRIERSEHCGGTASAVLKERAFY